MTQYLGKETKLAIENFKISNRSMPAEFIEALAHIKKACAKANHAEGNLDTKKKDVIVEIADKIISGQYQDQFPVDIFQTGSGTSSNMNINEVIANIAKESNIEIHPNDDVNKSQSSNDTIPSAIHLSANISVNKKLIPALQHLVDVIKVRENELKNQIKTGRTHLMDAMPVSFAQELSGWRCQIEDSIQRVKSCLPRLNQIAQGGTAVGTGINASKTFAANVAKFLKEDTKLDIVSSNNFFKSLSSQDTIVELSGSLNTLAVGFMKIANDLRWMNSGPINGLGEIELQALQAGSSIMPGKVNPVISESAMMVAAQIMGNNQVITTAASHGNFQLNVMLPVIADNILYSLQLAATTALNLADKAIKTFTVNEDNINKNLSRNPILVTALNTIIGYETGSLIAKEAFRTKRAVIDVALEHTNLSKEELEKLLNPASLI